MEAVLKSFLTEDNLTPEILFSPGNRYLKVMYSALNLGNSYHLAIQVCLTSSLICRTFCIITRGKVLYLTLSWSMSLHQSTVP